MNWWPSSFLTQSGATFLKTVFPKTGLLARINGASAAAQRMHDKSIGTGNVFHLFRLPENIEQEISELLIDDPEFAVSILSEDGAKEILTEAANGVSVRAIGPVLLERADLEQSTIQEMAGAYLAGFRDNVPVYPHYRGEAS